MSTDYDFLIVGGGMVADAAANAIREQGATGSIGIVGEEPTAPFPRPALSKKLWTDPDFTVENTDLRTADETGATLHLGERASGLDTGAKQVTTESGETYGYGSLLVATGGHPRQIEGLVPSERVIYFRSLTDYHQLRALAGGGLRVAVVGGSYIGTEIAAALSQQDVEVTLVFSDDVLQGSTFPDALATGFQQLFTDAGVRLVAGARVERGLQRGDEVELHLSNGQTVDADAVVVGLGIAPATDWLGGALDLADDGSVVVDGHLATSAPDVRAAGDVATYPDKILGRTRVEHVDNATEQGATAGRVLAGSDETYDHTPYFYSAVFGHRYEAVGTLDSSLETLVDERATGTVVYYLDAEAVRGVLLYDVPDGTDAARELLAGRRPANIDALAGRIG